MNSETRLVDIAHLNTLQEAYSLRAKLESRGITAFLPDEYTAQTLPIFGSSSQGYRIQVYLEDSLHAMDILYDEQEEEN